MRNLLIRFIVTLLAIAGVVYLLPQFFPDMRDTIRTGEGDIRWDAIAIFSVVLALINTFIRPVLKILALPITCLTAGLFSLVINVLMFFLAAWLSNSFLGTGVEINWFGAIIGALAVGVVSFIANLFLEDDI